MSFLCSLFLKSGETKSLLPARKTRLNTSNPSHLFDRRRGGRSWPGRAGLGCGSVGFCQGADACQTGSHNVGSSQSPATSQRIPPGQRDKWVRQRRWRVESNGADGLHVFRPRYPSVKPCSRTSAADPVLITIIY